MGIVDTILSFPVEAIVALILALFLLNYYIQLRIQDYLIFALVYLSSFFTALFTDLAIEFPTLLINYQLSFIFANLTFYLFLIHIRRIDHKNIKSKRFLIESIWLFGIIVVITQWELMTQPVQSKFFFITLDESSSQFIQGSQRYGAGLMLSDGTILLSTAHALVSYGFWAYIAVQGAYTYANLELPLESEQLSQVKQLWTIAFSITALWTISLLPFLFFDLRFNLLLIAAFVIKFYIAIRYREAILLSHVQIARGLDTFSKETSKVESNFSVMEGKETLVLKSLENFDPDEIKQKFEREKDEGVGIIILDEIEILGKVLYDDEADNDQIIFELISSLLIVKNDISNHEVQLFKLETTNFSYIIYYVNNCYIVYIFRGDTAMAGIKMIKFKEILEDSQYFNPSNNNTIDDLIELVKYHFESNS